jgi:hypothetical protein
LHAGRDAAHAPTRRRQRLMKAQQGDPKQKKADPCQYKEDPAPCSHQEHFATDDRSKERR